LPDASAFPWSRAGTSAGNLELCCCIRIRRTKVPKGFPELALAAALRRLQQELILLRQRDAEVDGEVSRPPPEAPRS
jgi:hypothetical protein